MKKRKKRNEIIVPVYKTFPTVLAEKSDEKTKEEAVEMVRKWLEENKL